MTHLWVSWLSRTSTDSTFYRLPFSHASEVTQDSFHQRIELDKGQLTRRSIIIPLVEVDPLRSVVTADRSRLIPLGPLILQPTVARSRIKFVFFCKNKTGIIMNFCSEPHNFRLYVYPAYYMRERETDRQTDREREWGKGKSADHEHILLRII